MPRRPDATRRALISQMLLGTRLPMPSGRSHMPPSRATYYFKEKDKDDFRRDIMPAIIAAPSLFQPLLWHTFVLLTVSGDGWGYFSIE